jgi:ethanolamine utilization protein EutQ (cupin superfamily)
MSSVNQSGVKHFRYGDLDMTADVEGTTHPLVNAGYSKGLGAGIGSFEDCSVPWTVTYDEVLFIKDGTLILRIGNEAHHAGPGDVLWIPAHTPLVYECKGRCEFFYAVYPVADSPSTGQNKAYPTAKSR